MVIRQIYGSIHYINTVKKEHLNISPNLRLDLSYTTFAPKQVIIHLDIIRDSWIIWRFYF